MIIITGPQLPNCQGPKGDLLWVDSIQLLGRLD